MLVIFKSGHIINNQLLIRVGKETRKKTTNTPAPPPHHYLLEWMDELLIIEYIKFSLGNYSVSPQPTTTEGHSRSNKIGFFFSYVKMDTLENNL